MRRVLVAGFVLLVGPHAGLAQSGPYHAVVGDAEVKLRAGPSDQFPETATLRPGSPLIVDHEEPNGWLAVMDAPGRGYSLSWVQMQFVDFNPQKSTPQPVVVQESTTLAAGQFGLPQPLHVRRTKVPAGTGLVVIGEKVQFEGKSWYPVMPPAGDFRYLPRQAVKYNKPADTTFVVRDSVPPPATRGSALPSTTHTPGVRPPVAVAPPGPAATAGKPAVQHPLWARAETAERDGRLDEAEKLFFQLAQVMNQPGGDHDIANLCYTRIHTLREKKRSVGSTARTSPPPRPPATSQPARSGSLPADERDSAARWTGPAKLVRSAVALEGRRTYVLASDRGETLWYVVPARGVDLERFVGNRVDIHGTPTTYRGLSKPLLVASRAELVR